MELHMTAAYAPYVLIYGVFPGLLLLLLGYVLSKFKFKTPFPIKTHLKLIVWNVLILLAVFVVVVLNASKNPNL